MKLIRKLHLYLGCLFAPLIIFFSITGAWQTFNFHEGSKDKTYTPPAWVSVLSETPDVWTHLIKGRVVTSQ